MVLGATTNTLITSFRTVHCAPTVRFAMLMFLLGTKICSLHWFLTDFDDGHALIAEMISNASYLKTLAPPPGCISKPQCQFSNYFSIRFYLMLSLFQICYMYLGNKKNDKNLIELPPQSEQIRAFQFLPQKIHIWNSEVSKSCLSFLCSVIS